ncbi:TfoX/Sxy family protein [uncultured Sphingomonas sp.]|uniref:TfoX/Sxy family protein n=1 Tax=uncultured Sphingomonas sp. TaxID=158754 RepID=UPI0035CA4BE9
MAVDAGLVAWVTEAMEPVGAVTHRAMMGGATLYLDGVVFAIVDDDALWFKADKLSDARWDAAGTARFTYSMGEGRTGTMNYRRAPDEIYDDADELRRWAALALEAGARGPAKRRRKE